LIEQRWPDRVATGPSSIDGTGVFAVRDFATEEVILTRDESRLVDDEQPLREEVGEHEWHCDWLENGRQVLLPSPERHVNHSCEPNTWTDFSQGAGRITALRTIRAGEELTCSYSLNLAGGSAWTCNCGSARCLKVVPGDFFELPTDRQIELVRFLAGWFVAEHREQYEELMRRTSQR
jgi:uncharacterized protein